MGPKGGLRAPKSGNFRLGSARVPRSSGGLGVKQSQTEADEISAR